MRYLCLLIISFTLIGCASTKNKYKHTLEEVTTNLDSTYIKQLELHRTYLYEATQRADSIVITKDKTIIYAPKSTSKAIEKEDVKSEEIKEHKQHIEIKKETKETKEKFQINFFYIILAIVIIYIVVKLINGGSFTNIKRLF